jgi:hypothetical protein
MKYRIEISSDKLTVCDTPLRAWLISLTLGVMGMGAILYNSSVTTFTCWRELQNQGSCELRVSSLRGSSVEKIQLNTLQRAEVQKSFSGRSKNYKVFLITNNGILEFISFSSKNNKDKIAAKINSFLPEYNNPFLKIVQDDRLTGFLFGLVFWTMGTVIFL